MANITNKISFKNMQNKALENLKEPKNLKDWFENGANHFENFSFNNALLINYQNSNATNVKSYDAWNYYGRSVKSRAKAIKIRKPEFAFERNKGDLANIIRGSLKKQMNENPQKTPEFKLGYSGYTFSMDKKGKISISIYGEQKGVFEKPIDFRRYLQNKVIGKVVTNYKIQNAFDISETYKPDYIYLNSGSFDEKNLVFNEYGEAITTENGKFKVLNTSDRTESLNAHKLDFSNINMDTKMNIIYEKIDALDKNVMSEDEIKAVKFMCASYFNINESAYYGIDDKSVLDINLYLENTDNLTGSLNRIYTCAKKISKEISNELNKENELENDVSIVSDTDMIQEDYEMQM